ncbi:hypothetical protein, partial [Xanthomonas euvesicatoria]|uniref:hypothetical protein n=1 Tax=Xanthomonas euvesicatoria TaxID=456327 RepID=UPI0019D0C956
NASREGTGTASYVNVGTFASKAEALLAAAHFASVGKASIDADPSGKWYGVSVVEDGSVSLDSILRHAWANGVSDAMIVRN